MKNGTVIFIPNSHSWTQYLIAVYEFSDFEAKYWKWVIICFPFFHFKTEAKWPQSTLAELDFDI